MSDYAFEGYTWSAATVTWSFETANYAADTANGAVFSNVISQPEYQAVVLLALQRWSAVTGVSFARVTDGPGADIRIGWGSFQGVSAREIGETDPNFDDADGTFKPDTIVRLQDPAFDPLNGDSPTTYTYAAFVTTLYQVALHELGHALGLAHSTDRTAIMYPVAGSANRELDASDVAGIQALYGQSFVGEATIAGADGATVAVGFDDAAHAALAQSLLAGVGDRGRVTFVDSARSGNAADGSDAIVDDAVGAVTMATSTALNQTVVAGGGGLALAAYGSGTVVAGGGANQIFVTAASAGPWDIVLGNARNTVVAATGNETVAAGTGANLVFLGAGGSSVLSSGVDTIVGFAGNDTVAHSGPGALVFGGAGGVMFSAGSGASTVVGGAGRLDASGGGGGGVFFGGTAGNNQITAGAGRTTIVGGGEGDVLRAAGASDDVIAAGSGAETVDGTGATGALTFFAGPGADRVVSGGASTAVQVGSGNETLVGGTGYSLYAFLAGHAGGVDVLSGFDPVLDRLTLLGYAPDAVATALAGATTIGGSETLTLSDGTRVLFAGATGVQASSFV